MRIGIVGLGAIGGFFAARLARSGVSVCALVRGETLEAVRRHGLTLVEPGGAHRFSVPVEVSDQPAELGIQDILVISLKTTGLPEVAPRLAPMIGPQTIVLSAMNGIPWWFFEGLSPAMAERPLDSVDPDGRLRALLPAAQIIGAVTHMSASIERPGVVRHNAGDRIIVGDPSGGDPAASPRCAAVMAAFSKAGFQMDGSRRIQLDIWQKLWGNMTVNPVSAITGVTADLMLDDPLVRDYMTRCMLEAGVIGEKIGLPITMNPQERHEITRKLGALRSSMLQDVDAGRPIELDSLLGSVVEIGRRVNVPAPNLESLLGLTRLRARQLGLYPSASASAGSAGLAGLAGQPR